MKDLLRSKLMGLFNSNVRNEIMSNLNKSEESGGICGGIVWLFGDSEFELESPHNTHSYLLGLKILNF